MRSFGIDPRSFHASTASKIRNTTRDDNSEVTDDGTNQKRRTTSLQLRQDDEVTTSDEDSNNYKRRRRQRQQRQTQEVVPPTSNRLTKLSRTLYEAKTRSKRIVTRRNFDAYRQETQYEEWPLQGFALDHLNTLLQPMDAREMTMTSNETVGDDNLRCDTIGGDGGDSRESANNNDNHNLNNLGTNINNINNKATTINNGTSPKQTHKTFSNSNTTTTSNKQNQPQDENLFPSSPLWSMEPRIFAVERAAGGKRKYICAHLGRFMHHYWRECDPSARHYYELIRDGDPCRLYFDLEYTKRANPNINSFKSEQLINEFLSELRTELQNTYNITIERKHIVDLDSSTNSKFSRHFIVHFPKGELFSNAVECGHFVKRFVGRLAEEVATGVLDMRCPTLAECLFVNTTFLPTTTTTTNTDTITTVIGTTDTDTSAIDKKGQIDDQKDISEASPLVIMEKPVVNLTDRTIGFGYPDGQVRSTSPSSSTIQEPPSTTINETQHESVEDAKDTIQHKTTCFVDTGVYTRNRLFRLMGSTKYGKPASAALHISSTNEFSFSEKIGNEHFYVPEMMNTTTKKSCMELTKMRCYYDEEEEDFDKQLNWESHATALADTLIVPINYRSIDTNQILPIMSPPKQDRHQQIKNNNIRYTPSALRNQACIPLHTNRISPSKQAYSIDSSPISPFPTLDQFVNNVLGTRNGIRGQIRAWSIEYNEFQEGNSNLSSSIVTYQMKENRWCENINRPHKSNNIIWVVSIKCMQYWQSCHDPTCRQLSFRGKMKDLPLDVRQSIGDVLLENALKVDEAFEKALLSINVQNDDKSLKIMKQKKSNNNRADESFHHALTEALSCDPHLFP